MLRPASCCEVAFPCFCQPHSSSSLAGLMLDRGPGLGCAATLQSGVGHLAASACRGLHSPLLSWGS